MSLGERFRQGQGVLDVLRRTSKRKASSNKSSTPMASQSQSMSASSSNFATTPNGQDAARSTRSTLSPSGCDLSGPSCPNPEIEGELEVEFTIKIRSFGIYRKVEHSVAHNLAIALYRTFGNDSWELRDELGRIVLFDVKASFGSDEQIHYVEGPK